MPLVSEICPGVENYQGKRRLIPGVKPAEIKVERVLDAPDQLAYCGYYRTGDFCGRPYSLPSDPNRSPLSETCKFFYVEPPVVAMSTEEISPPAVDELPKAEEPPEPVRPTLDFTLIPVGINAGPKYEPKEDTSEDKVIELTPGIKLFGNIKVIPDYDWESNYRRWSGGGNDIEPLLTIETRLNGVKGEAKLTPYFTNDDGEFEDADKPLQIKVTKTYIDIEDEKRIKTIVGYEVLPVQLDIVFYPKSYEEVELLYDRYIQLQIGNKTYHIYRGGYEKIYKEDFEDQEQVELAASLWRDGDETTVLLPIDLQKLRNEITVMDILTTEEYENL